MTSERRIDKVGTLPILGICGFSGSGKTTLIEAVLPGLIARNLKVAVVKHTDHALDVDHPGKDSDRLFRAGADVFFQGDETLIRLHDDGFYDLLSWLQILGKQYDLILVEGHKQSPLQKVWLLHEGEVDPPDNIVGIRAVLQRDKDRVENFMIFLTHWLSEN